MLMAAASFPADCRRDTLPLLLFMEEMARSLTVHIIVGRAVKKHLLLQMENLIGLLHCISEIMGYHKDRHPILAV
jgi:hypothetical protein